MKRGDKVILVNKMLTMEIGTIVTVEKILDDIFMFLDKDEYSNIEHWVKCKWFKVITE